MLSKSKITDQVCDIRSKDLMCILNKAILYMVRLIYLYAYFYIRLKLRNRKFQLVSAERNK